MGRKKKHPEIIEQLGQPICNADGTPNIEFYPKKRRVGRPSKQDLIDRGAMQQEKEIWRQVPNLSPNCIVWVSNKGNVRLGAQATKESDGSVSIYIDGCKIPLDVLVYAAFQNPVNEPDWSNHVLIHKNGDMADNRFMNLDTLQVPAKALNEKHIPIITPTNVLNHYYPEFIKNSEMLRIYYEQKERGLTTNSYDDHLTPNMVHRFENIAETVVSRMLAGFVMDGVRGDARFSSPFFRTSGSNFPPEFRESGNKDTDEHGIGLPGSLDIIERNMARTQSFRTSAETSNPLDLLNEEVRWQYRKIAALQEIWMKKSGELKSVKYVHMPNEWKQFGKAVQTVLLQKQKKRSIDKDFQIAIRIFDSGEALFYMVPMRIWKRAERLLKKIIDNTEMKLPEDILLADIKERKNEDGSYSYSYIQKIKKERKDVQEKRQSAADWFANAYNIGSSEGIMENTELKQDVIECNKFEMILVLVEKLWNAETQILYDEQQLHMKLISDQDAMLGINQRRMQKWKDRQVEKGRQEMQKTGKIKVELLTPEERQMLLDQLRKINIDKDALLTVPKKNRRSIAIKVKAILPLKKGQVQNTILVFDSIKKAAADLGLYPYQISEAIHGERSDVHGIVFECLEPTDQVNAIWKYIQKYQQETEQIVAEEKKRIQKEIKDFGVIKGGFQDNPQNVMPRGKRIVNGGLVDDDYDSSVNIGLPGRPAASSEDSQQTTIGDLLDAEKKRADVRNKKRNVGVDGKEIYDDDDLDRLLDDD